MKDSKSSLSSAMNSTIAQAALSDTPSLPDRLGFTPYVRALADFLTSHQTHPPLTVSIEGEWGTGKSSFMKQLCANLEAKGYRTVEFNAWRHESAEVLWTSFATHFLKSLSKRVGWWRRRRAHIFLWCRQLDWGKAWFPILRTLLGSILIITVGVALGSELISFGLNPIEQTKDLLLTPNGEFDFGSILGSTGLIGLLIYLLFPLREIDKALGNPLSLEINEYLRSPAYKEHTSFLEDFEKHIGDAIDAYSVGRWKGPSKRIFVFIDDLDRSSVHKAADLMRAINLLISTSDQLVFILGIDRLKVAAGIGASNRESLHFHFPDAPTMDNGNIMPTFAREFGYAYLEKFIQLPFRLPSPTASELRRLLQGGTTSPDSDNPPEYREVVRIVSGEDSAEVAELALMVAPVLDYNPRRIKQFINLFRLKAHICAATGLFRAPPDAPNSALTLPQLAKWIAILQRWPTITLALEENPDLFKSLYEANESIGLKGYWAKQRELLKLLYWRSDPDLPALDDPAYSLRDLDIAALMRTSPAVEPLRNTVASDLPPVKNASTENSFEQSVGFGQSVDVNVREDRQGHWVG